MEKIKLLCIGQCKEKSIDLLSKEYVNRIKAFLPFTLCELKDKKGKRDSADESVVIEQLEKQVQSGDFLVLLDSAGKMMSSEQFSAWMADYFVYQQNPIVFFVGGASGIPSPLYQRSHLKLSFSKMTFPHELFRLMLLEQIYRSLTIIHHYPYHK